MTSQVSRFCDLFGALSAPQRRCAQTPVAAGNYRRFHAGLGRRSAHATCRGFVSWLERWPARGAHLRPAAGAHGAQA